MARPRGIAIKIYQLPHTPLNETGEGQAALAAKALATTRIGKLVASPMARAWRTASLIAHEHKMHPEVDGALSRALLRQPLGQADRRRIQLGLGPRRLRAARDLRAARRAEHRCASSKTTRRDGETVIVAHGGILLVACALTQATLEHSHRRNAVPLRFARENGAWTATPL